MEIVGIDIGFGYTKVTDGRHALTFKSVFGEAKEAQFREHLLDGSAGEAHLHVEFDDKAYFVGELAESQSTQRSFTLDPKEFVADFTKVLALAPLAIMVKRLEPVRLVAGLPISHYRVYKDEVAAQLTGQHAVKAFDRNGAKLDTVVKIDEVKVVPQPFGSVFNAMLTDTGELSDSGYGKQKIGVIDVGFRTTDLTISDRTKYSERGSHTTDAGIAKAYATIAAALHEASGVQVELYRLYDAVAKGSIKIYGKTYDLASARDKAFEQLANAIAADANQLWAADWDMDAIMITGGGGSVLAPYLTDQLRGEVIPVAKGSDQRMNNAKGYLKYGKRLWQRGGREKKEATEPETAQTPA